MRLAATRGPWHRSASGQPPPKVKGEKSVSMTEWVLSFDDCTPENEGRREVLCALGNGYIVSRAAAPDAVADDVHYPGTYLAGGYNRLVSEIEGQEIENEDLVNLPNWLPLVLAIEDGPWLRPDTVTWLDCRQQLDLRTGTLTRHLRLRDDQGRVIRWEEIRFVSQDDAHLAGLKVIATPENFSGRLRIRSAIDGGVINWGVKRYRALNGKHMQTDFTKAGPDGILSLRSRMVQCRREVALATRTLVSNDGIPVTPASADTSDSHAEQIFQAEFQEGRPVHIEKIASYYNSRDRAIAEPLTDAVEKVRHARGFDRLHEAHARAWEHHWEQCDIQIDSTSNHGAQLKLRLHIFHLLQTASLHSIDMDVGVPPRGWHGEAYRGHIMWDELFIFPFLTLRMPVLTRALLRYRYRRLDEARRMAQEAGYAGAMFPWQSGSNGREESQRIHLNPMSGQWIADNSWRQHHVGAAICYNIWSYYEATDDREFLKDYGAELFCEIARFWASIAEKRADGRYVIRRVMGPDEFHTAYPGTDARTEGGIDNNAYTNFLVAWLLSRVPDVLDLLPGAERRRLREHLGLDDAELQLWHEISCNLVIPFHDGTIISQFDGYGDLKEFDWDKYRRKYPDLQRLDRILDAEQDDPNNYKVSKQADLLMIFYLFSREEIEQLFDRLGYAFTPDLIFDNIRYYMHRTSHGSTLSWITHAWVLARSDRQRSWQLALQALDADFSDIQGGTTPEGIHLGAMAGTVDLIQRCYTGIEVGSGVLMFNPRLPDEVRSLKATIRYRHQVLDVTVTQDCLTVESHVMTAQPVTIAYRGHSREISPGQCFTFPLVREHKPDRAERVEEQERARLTSPTEEMEAPTV